MSHSCPARAFSKIAIIPGNGCVEVRRCNWYGWLADALADLSLQGGKSYEDVLCEDMPDPFDAKRDIWLSHMKDVLNIDENTLAIGHSSGSEALMRYAETEKVGAIILVSACFTDLGDEGERRSGYYPSRDGTSNKWDFEAMTENCPVFFQFHSDNDPFIPLGGEALAVKEGLGLEDSFVLLPRRSHFFDAPFPELLELVDQLTC